MSPHNIRRAVPASAVAAAMRNRLEEEAQSYVIQQHPVLRNLNLPTTEVGPLVKRAAEIFRRELGDQYIPEAADLATASLALAMADWRRLNPNLDAKTNEKLGPAGLAALAKADPDLGGAAKKAYELITGGTAPITPGPQAAKALVQETSCLWFAPAALRNSPQFVRNTLGRAALEAADDNLPGMLALQLAADPTGTLARDRELIQKAAARDVSLLAFFPEAAVKRHASQWPEYVSKVKPFVDLGIRCLFRYHAGLGCFQDEGGGPARQFKPDFWAEIRANRLDPSNQRGDPRPLCVAIFPTAEADPAEVLTLGELAELTRGYRVLYYEAGSDTEWVAALEDATQNGSHPCEFLVMTGHGQRGGLTLAHNATPMLGITGEVESRYVDTSDRDQLVAANLGSMVAPGAHVVIESCSTAVGGAGDDNLATMMATVLPRATVWAPMLPAVAESSVYELDASGRFKNVRFKCQWVPPDTNVTCRIDPRGDGRSRE